VPDQPAEGLSDGALLARTANGDRAAFDLIVDRHRASVFRLARLLVPQQHEAEDVLQQAFLAAWRSASQFRGDASLRTWLLTITRHTALRMRERRHREPIDETPLDELGRAAGWGGPDPEALALASERRELLAAAFEALTPEDREVITLRDLEGLSGEQTAALLGVGLAAMKSRLHRARLALAVRVRNEVSRATGRA
jgi:RNA polymerase sigma-70 factor, ECF subfamily